MGRLTDTSPDADRVRTEIYRRMSLGQKWLLLGEDYHTARILHGGGYRLRHPAATAAEIHKDWLVVNFGFVPTEALPLPAWERGMQNLQVLREVAGAFDRLGIPYALGGSMASSLHGIDRSTKDADLTVEPFPGKENQFAASFGQDYYISLPAIQDAVRRRSSFNIIHTSSGFKVDVFICKDRAFEQSIMQRRIAVVLPDVPQQPVVLVSPEDIILLKLEWYRLGDESSDRQWTDVLGVMKIQADKLDQAYMEKWAADLSLGDLLQRARQEAGTGAFG